MLPTWRPVVALVLLPKVLSLWLWLEQWNTDAWMTYMRSGCSGVTKSEICISPGMVLLLNLVWAKGLVSEKLPAIQPHLGFCWGFSETSRSRSHVLVKHTAPWVVFFVSLILPYPCTKSLVWSIFLPMVPSSEQATVTMVLVELVIAVRREATATGEGEKPLPPWGIGQAVPGGVPWFPNHCWQSCIQSSLVLLLY